MPMTTLAQLVDITLTPNQAIPLYRQLYAAMRAAILEGRLVVGTRLPPTRALATELGVSRNTVMLAFAQLLAEGYVVGKVGSGTFVASTLPEDMLHVRHVNVGPSKSATRTQTSPLSRRGAQLAQARVTTADVTSVPHAFRPGVPALDAFPFAIWARLAARRYHAPDAALLAYGDPAGYHPLRKAIAAYLGAARGVRCEPEQVIIVSGSQQGIDLAARLLLDAGDAVWVEDPGYGGARGALQGAGAHIIPLPIDDEGLDVAAGSAGCPTARLAYVTPSHQYPLGVTMSLRRRLALLEWAALHHAWVLEDDYDSEYRYRGRPLAALQGLDTQQRVIYLGTFSKVMFPALRLGYLVVPPDLVAAFTAARALTDRHSPSLEQAILTDFIVAGHFERHIRRMRALYAERQAVLVTTAARLLGGLLDVAPAAAGLHIVGWLPAGVGDRHASSCAATYGVDAPALSRYASLPQPKGGLLLGYANTDAQQIRVGMEKMARALAEKAVGVKPNR